MSLWAVPWRQISELPFASESKRSFMQNHSYENVFPKGPFSRKSNSFSFEIFFTRIQFKTEAQGNSEMVYSPT